MTAVLIASDLLSLLELVQPHAKLPHGLNHERHGKIHDIVPPGELQNHIAAQQIVALEQTGTEALEELLVEEPGDQVLGQLDLFALARVRHSVLVESVGLAQLDRLLPPVVALVQVGRDAAELDELVLLEPLRQAYVVEVIVGVDAVAQALEVLLLDEQVVERLVYGLVVVVLHRAQVGLDQRQLMRLDEEIDRARVVETRRQHCEQVVQKHGLEVQVELDGLVVQLDVGYFGDYVL